jgi:predicted Rossmann-fold nucleotide-binding protein
MEHVPLILVGEEYWEGLFDWMHQNMVEHNLLTNHIDDLNILHIVDSREDVLSCVSGYCETEL